MNFGMAGGKEADGAWGFKYRLERPLCQQNMLSLIKARTYPNDLSSRMVKTFERSTEITELSKDQIFGL